MTKKKKKRALVSARGPLDSARGFGRKNLSTELIRAEKFILQEQWQKAYNVLSAMGETYPQEVRIWQYLTDVCLELENIPGYQRACEHWLAIAPHNADVLYALGGTYLQQRHPLLALRTLRQALAIAPDKDQVRKVQRIVNKLELEVPTLLEELNLPQEKAWDIAILHEQGQAYLEEGEYKKARHAEALVLEQQPGFSSAKNNLSLIAWVEDNPDEAIHWSKAVLETESDNIHALSNLVRYSALLGDLKTAQQYIEPLLSSQAKAWDGWTKKVEALSYLAEDERIVNLYGQLKKTDSDEMPTNGSFYHLVAVALARLDRKKEAKALWKKSLHYNPYFDLAKENLKEMSYPIGQQHGAWPFPAHSWLPPQASQDFMALMDPLIKSTNKTDKFRIALTQFVEAHPLMVKQFPRLLERGGPSGQMLIIEIIKAVKTPELLEILKDFVLGKNGTDALRYENALVVANAGLIRKDQLRLWLQGKWHDTMLLTYQFDDKPTFTHPKKVTNLIGHAIEIMHNNPRDRHDWAKAERYLDQALVLAPGSPDILNNLAITYQQQGRDLEARVILEDLAEQYPDYLFAKVILAQQLTDEKKYDDADALLRGFINRERFNFQEFATFVDAYIRLFDARGKQKEAKSWLQVWEQVDPEHPRLHYWKKRLGKLGGIFR